MFGIFDQKEDYFHILEERYMKEKRLKYTEVTKSSHGSRDKGCFEILAWNVKSEIVKQLQRCGKKVHGFYITLQLPMNKKGNRIQRKKGKFYDEFIKHCENLGNEKTNLQHNEENDDENGNEVRII